jgi:uncharacterized protein YndB with AHSA1/START domain
MIESVRDAAVAPADVFRLYADPSTWSRWGHNAKSAYADGPLVEGGTVDVRAGYGKVYPCRIRRLVAGRALELEVRPPLMTVINTYEVEPTADGAHIRHALEVRLPACQIRVDAQRPDGVAKLADLPIDPRPVDRDWCTRRLAPVCR